jgi:hypothetical protein
MAGERWDRDRFERMSRGRPDDDGASYTRSTRPRDHSDERYDRRPGRGYYDEDDMGRDRRYPDDPRYPPQLQRERERDREAPPPWARRTDVLERERERDYPRRESPRRRPGFLRRQSSLDTYDRRPRFLDHREEYPAPARREDVRPRDPREDYRPPPYQPIPLPKSRGLPPPRRYNDEHYDDIKIAEPDYYGDEDFRSMPERVREREYTRSRKSRGRGRDRDRSRESRSTRTRSVRSSSYSSASSSRSSSSSGGTTVRSEYPKKGKTRIPAKLVSKRALIDLGYPFFEEGTTIIVQKALGQDNIDELLKVSEDYKKVEAEIAASREPKAPTAALPAPPETVREPTPEPPPAKTPPPPAQEPPTPMPPVQATPVPPPAQQAPPQPMPMPTPAPPPIYYQPPPPQMAQPVPPAFYQPAPPPAGPPPMAAPPMGPPPQQSVYDYEETVIRDVSPSRTMTSMSSYDSYYRDSYHHHHHPEELVVRTRSKSRSRKDIRREIKDLERELTHRPRGHSTGGELVRAERLPDGQLVIREERVEKEVLHRKPPRIEKDKKGPPPKLMRAMFATLT